MWNLPFLKVLKVLKIITNFSSIYLIEITVAVGICYEEVSNSYLHFNLEFELKGSWTTFSKEWKIKTLLNLISHPLLFILPAVFPWEFAGHNSLSADVHKVPA